MFGWRLRASGLPIGPGERNVGELAVGSCGAAEAIGLLMLTRASTGRVEGFLSARMQQAPGIPKAQGS